ADATRVAVGVDVAAVVERLRNRTARDESNENGRNTQQPMRRKPNGRASTGPIMKPSPLIAFRFWHLPPRSDFGRASSDRSMWVEVEPPANGPSGRWRTAERAGILDAINERRRARRRRHRRARRAVGVGERSEVLYGRVYEFGGKSGAASGNAA